MSFNIDFKDFSSFTPQFIFFIGSMCLLNVFSIWNLVFKCHIVSSMHVQTSPEVKSFITKVTFDQIPLRTDEVCLLIGTHHDMRFLL